MAADHWQNWCLNEDIDSASEWLKKNNVNTGAVRGYYPIHNAVIFGKTTQMLKLILDSEHSANVNIQTEKNMNVVSLEDEWHKLKTDQFYDFTDENSRYYNNTALHMAAREGNVDMVKMLIEKEANPELRDSQCGETALHKAALMENLEVMKVLVTEGKGNLGAINYDGKSVMDFIHSSHLEEIFDACITGSKRGKSLILIFQNPIHMTFQNPNTVNDTSQNPNTINGTSQNLRYYIDRSQIEKCSTVNSTSQNPCTVIDTSQNPSTVNGTSQKPSIVNVDVENPTIKGQSEEPTSKKQSEEPTSKKQSEEPTRKQSEEQQLRELYSANTICYIPPIQSEEPTSKKHARRQLTEWIAIFNLVRRKDSKKLMTHPIIAYFIWMRWNSVKTAYFINVGLYLTFLLFLHFFIFMDIQKYAPTTIEGMKWTTFTCVLLLSVNEIFEFVQAVYSLQPFRKSGDPRSPITMSQYIRNPENWRELMLSIVTYFLIFLPSEWNEFKNHLRALVLLISWVEGLLLISHLPKLSTYRKMFIQVSWNFFKFLIWMLGFVIAFGLSFFFLHLNEENHPTDERFNTTTNALLQTFVMSFGSGAEMLPGNFSKFILVLFVFFICLVITNLLNGLAIADIGQLQKESASNSHIALVDQIYKYEAIHIFYRNKFTTLSAFFDKLIGYPTKYFWKNIAKFEEEALWSNGEKVEIRKNGSWYFKCKGVPIWLPISQRLRKIVNDGIDLLDKRETEKHEKNDKMVIRKIHLKLDKLEKYHKLDKLNILDKLDRIEAMLINCRT